MDIFRVLEELDVTENTLTDEEKKCLDEQGYVVFEGLIDPTWLYQLRQAFEKLHEVEGISAGKEVHKEQGARRLADLVNKGEVFDRVYTHPKVLAAVYRVLDREFHLYSLNGRDAKPGEGLQGLHTDWGRRELDEPFHVCNSIWLLDDFTEENGATRLVPGTHLKPGLPSDYMKNTSDSHPDEQLLIARAGTVAVFNSHTWHGGTVNKSKDQIRRALHCAYSGREHEQQTNQRKYIRKVTYDRISPFAKYILNA